MLVVRQSNLKAITLFLTGGNLRSVGTEIGPSKSQSYHHRTHTSRMSNSAGKEKAHLAEKLHYVGAWESA